VAAHHLAVDPVAAIIGVPVAAVIAAADRQAALAAVTLIMTLTTTCHFDPT
jgi:hypothetical protein